MSAGMPAAPRAPSDLADLPERRARGRWALLAGMLVSLLLHLPLLASRDWMQPPEALPTELSVTLPATPLPPKTDWLAEARKRAAARPLAPASRSRPSRPATPPAMPPESPEALSPEVPGPPEAQASGPPEVPPAGLPPSASDGPQLAGPVAAGAIPPVPAEPPPGTRPAAPVDAAPGPAAQAAPTVDRLSGLPLSGEVDYRVTKGSGEWKTGRGTLRWRIEGDHYRLDLDARAEGLPGLIYWNGIHWSSEGTVSPDRLRPERFSRDNSGGARFDWASHTLTLLPSGGVRPLADGAQDVLSVFFQFALRPPADDTLDFQVTNGDKVDRYAFEMTERVRLRLEIGEVDTIHISRLHKVEESGFEIWLAEDRNFLPVQMRLYSVRIGVVNLYATGIRINGLQGRLREP